MFAQEYVEALYETLGTPCCISDRDEVVAAAGVSKKEYEQRRLALMAEELMLQRKMIIEKMETVLEIVPGQFESIKSYAVGPIFSNGDVIGVIYIFSKVHFVGEIEQKVIETAASFLAKQMRH